MGELLIGLLRASFFGSYFLLLAAGLYCSASWWSAQAWREPLLTRADPQTVTMLQYWTQTRSALELALYPRSVWFHLSREAFPVLSNPVQLIEKGKVGSGLVDAKTFDEGFAFPLIALLLAFGGELIAFPLLRTRLARSLATEKGEGFGKPSDLPRGDGFVLAHRLQLASDGGGNPHVLTVAPSGKGKSSSQVLPSILSLPDDCALVCTDPKGEIFARSAAWLHKRGHKVVLLSPSLGYGWGWDPLSECRTADEVRELARVILGSMSEKQDEWTAMSRPLLSAYLVEAWASKKPLTKGLQMLFQDSASGTALSDPRAKSDFALFEVGRGASATAGSILMTLQGACSPWLNEQVVGWIEHPKRFKFSDIREKRAAVFLATSASDMRATQAIQHVFFSMLFSRLAEGRGTRVRMILDEFGNLGRLEGIDQSLNLLRSAGVGIHAHVQNLPQLRAVYGPAAGDVVNESFGTVCVMSGLRNDAQDLAKMLTLKPKVRASYSTQDEKMRAQFSAQDQQEQGAMIRQIRKDQVMIISGHHRPVIARLKPWYRTPKLRNRVIPDYFRADWSKIPEEKTKQFMARFGAVEPRQLDLTPTQPADQGPTGGGGKLRKRRSENVQQR